MSRLEADFQPIAIEAIKQAYPGAVVFKTDTEFNRSFPDLMVLYNRFWAAIETKRYSNSTRRPNQPYHVKKLNEMSYSTFLHRGNLMEVLDELEYAFRPCQ